MDGAKQPASRFPQQRAENKVQAQRHTADHVSRNVWWGEVTALCPSLPGMDLTESALTRTPKGTCPTGALERNARAFLTRSRRYASLNNSGAYDRQRKLW